MNLIPDATENAIVHLLDPRLNSDQASNGFVIHKESDHFYLVADLNYLSSSDGTIEVNGITSSFKKVAYDQKVGFSVLKIQGEHFRPLPFKSEISNNSNVKVYVCLKVRDQYPIDEKEAIIVAGKDLAAKEWAIRFSEAIPNDFFKFIHPVVTVNDDKLIGFIKVSDGPQSKETTFTSINYIKKIWLGFPEEKKEKPSAIDAAPASPIVDFSDNEDLLIRMPNLYLPRDMVSDVLPDITTPGISEQDFVESYLKVMDRKQVNELVLQHERSIVAVEKGDFIEFTKVAENIRNLDSDISEVAATGTYLMGEGYRLLADEAKTVVEKESYYRQAEDLYTLAITQNPINSKPFRGLGAIYEKRHDYAQAHKYYWKAYEFAQSKLAIQFDEKKRLGAIHDMLRISRHLINNIINMRQTSPQSAWHKPDRESQLMAQIEECEKYHRAVMPLFSSRPVWYYFEWFAGWLFIAKAWADVGRPVSKNNSLIFALGNRKKMFVPNARLTDIDKSNIEWWIRTYRYKISKDEERYTKEIHDLELSLNTGEVNKVIQRINVILNPFQLIY